MTLHLIYLAVSLRARGDYWLTWLAWSLVTYPPHASWHIGCGCYPKKLLSA